MSKYIFCAPFQVGLGPVMPPLDAAKSGGLQLTYLVNGVRTGGYACVGHVPQAPTCLVWVDTSDETAVAMATGEDYLFIEEVLDAPAAELQAIAAKDSPVAKKPKRKDKAKIKQWLKNKGHKSKDVDDKAWESNAEVRSSLCGLHKVMPERYKEATGITAQV